MTYASYDDLVTRFGETKLTQLTDRATPLARVPDRGVIEAALAPRRPSTGTRRAVI